jgi:hypothetical protein
MTDRETTTTDYWHLPPAEREAYACERMNELAKFDDWSGWTPGLDVPSTADWLVRHAGALDRWDDVVSVLTSVATDCMDLDEAAARLAELLP